MYKEYFGLQDAPFSIAPNPRYLYMSGGHREALAHLLYGVTNDGGGFILLTGEVGTGKTTVCRSFLDQLPPATDVAFLLNPKLTLEEMLATVCDELGIGYPEGNNSVKVFVDRLNTHLLEAHAGGRRTVLIIEEAQNLGLDLLEQLRLLTNLETGERKLLQIILIGQPELRDMLSRPELRQLSQRISARYHLGPLAKGEVAAYVEHRLSVAGGRDNPFSPLATRKLVRLSGGVPRLINLLCDRALLGIYAQGLDRVNSATLDKAASEVLGKPAPLIPPIKYRWLLAAALFALFLAFAGAYMYHTSLSAAVNRLEAGIGKNTAGVKAEPHLDTLWWFTDWTVRERPGRIDPIRKDGSSSNLPAEGAIGVSLNEGRKSFRHADSGPHESNVEKAVPDSPAVSENREFAEESTGDN